ncbi:MAG: response regulator [Bacteroidales bacterium]|nr:response regulator [Bacteroidales bacterium]
MNDDNPKILQELQNENNQLRQKLSDYSGLTDLIPEVIFELDLKGRLRYINKKGLEKFGYNYDEFIETFTLAHFFPEDAETIMYNIGQSMKGEPFEKKAYIATLKDGKRIPMIASTTIIEKEGKPVGLRGVLVDVSQQIETEEKYRALFNSSPFSTIIFDPENGQILEGNKISTNLFQSNYQQLKEKNIFYYVQDNEHIAFRKFIQDLIESDKLQNTYNTKIQSEKKEDKDVIITSSKIYNQGKTLVQSIIQDITEFVKQNKIENEQRQQKELLAQSVFQLSSYKDKDAIFKFVAETLFAFNKDSVIVVGDYIEATHKMKLNQILGVSLDRFGKILNVDIHQFQVNVIDYQLPENTLFVDIEELMNENNFYNIISKAKVSIAKKALGVKKIFTSKLKVNNQILGGIAVLTPNKNFLEENAFIEIFIKQAEVILDRITYEKELIIAKENAIESDRLKSAFLSNMSHEIRTPMNSILGFTSLILSEEVTDDLKSKYASLIQNSGDVLVKLIDDFIDISKIESNQLTVSCEEFDINEMIEELDMEYHGLNMSVETEVELIFEYDKNPVNMKSDRSRLKQILNNLINNSIKFTKKGEIRVWYHIHRETIHFHVKDTGIGIPKDKQNIIFDRFRQADESSTRPFRGAGLGLAISKHIANLLEGDVLVNSHRNYGAEFIVTVPTGIAQIYHMEKKSIIKPLIEITTKWQGFTVFIAEDEESNYFLLEAYLRKTGINIEWFKNGKDLIKAIQEKEPHVILLDLKMPIMDGYEAAKKIKEFSPNLHIIAQTAYAMADEKRKAIQFGCDDFITKPVKKDILFYKLGKVLNTK